MRPLVSHQICIRAFGVVLAIRVSDPAHLTAARRVLPPGHEPALLQDALEELVLDVPPGGDLSTAVGELDARVRRLVATHAPRHVFVHAGVVARSGRALVLPAPTFAGKTELVGALVSAGAVYYSDEYAVLDEHGLVQPYARPLSLRPRHGRGGGHVTAGALGGSSGTEPAPVGLIAATSYDPAATWAPAERSPAEGVLLMLAHAGQARDDPARVLDVLQRASGDARVLEGPRGEAAPTAAALLAALG